jgi:hypothetical protein
MQPHEKDLEFVSGLYSIRLVQLETLLQRVTEVEAPSELLSLARKRIAALHS